MLEFLEECCLSAVDVNISQKGVINKDFLVQQQRAAIYIKLLLFQLLALIFEIAYIRK